MDVFGARSLPFMTRRNYVHEAVHLLPWGIVVGLAEGNVSAVVVAKTFGGSELLIGLAVASTMFAKLVSLIWGMLSVGRPKLRVLSVLGAATVMCLASVAATPQSSWGGWVFVGQMAATQAFLAGVVTLRTALWKSNYPREYRGRITARLQLIRLLTSIGAMAAAAMVFDRDATAYRFVYPLAALCGACAIVVVGRMRVRGENAELRRMSAAMEQGLDSGLAEPFSLAAVLSPGHVLGQMRRILREDRAFARYCKALMWTGSANLMVAPVLATIVTREMQLNYLVSVGLLDILPRTVMLIALFRWAPFFDRVGVVRYRVVSGLFWLSFLVLGTIATLVVVNEAGIGPAAPVIAIAVYGLSRVCMGMGLGGGMLAWNLGHLHFAPAHEAEIYMGVHVTLTGLRGLVMPLLGIWLWMVVGWWVWLLASCLSLVGFWGYVAMAREEGAEAGSEK
ncbi:MAG TPA: MFS transporter [Phycisphaerae bacterium]|nr:MFS transporter [Phycisphaerae bacterium]